MEYILTVDQGTTSTRAFVYDRNGLCVSGAQAGFTQIFPGPGMVEHSPEEIMRSADEVIERALSKAGLSARDIAAAGITNQRETAVVWDRKTGEPVYNAIVWQCRRTAEYCKRLADGGLSEVIYGKTGLRPDAYFSATKVKWILDNVGGARERAERGELCFGTIDTYLLFKLSGGKIFATDYTNASRTMLFNIYTLKWDEDLLRLFGIPAAMLPEAYPSAHDFGAVADGALKGAHVCGVAGDQQSSLFGQACFKAGDIKNTYGTGCFLLMNTGEKPVKSANGLLTTLCASAGGKPCFALEGSVFSGGATVQWLRDGLKAVKTAKATERAAKKVADNGGVYLVPAFTGLGAPYWDSAARGTITGLSRGVTKNHIIRAGLESIAYRVRDVAVAMERDSGCNITRLSADGGASANNFLMQFQADILAKEVTRARWTESTSLGAAYLAGLGCGIYKSEEDILKTRRGGGERIFYPSMEAAERHALIAGWEAAVARARL